MVHSGPDTAVMLVSQTGEDLCLAFANTLAWRGRAASVENLTDFGAVLAWAETNVALPGHLAAVLRGWAREHPSRTTTALADAVALREAIHGIAGALACGEPVGTPRLRGAKSSVVRSAHPPTAGALGDRLCLADRAWTSRRRRPSNTSSAGACGLVGCRSHGGKRAEAHPPMRKQRVLVAVHRR